VNQDSLRTIATAVNLGFALSEQLRELAAQHGRNFVGEARAAVCSYLKAHGAATRRASPAGSQSRPEGRRPA
jgi:hypothetical protein